MSSRKSLVTNAPKKNIGQGFQTLEEKVVLASVGGEIFLQGDYLEVGIHESGSFGTSNAAPAGFHPINRSQIGFVSDPGKDGWNFGSSGQPAQSGDYFLPGSPEEGWTLEWDGAVGQQNFNNRGRAGSFDIPKTSLIETSAGDTRSAVWTGTATAGSEAIAVEMEHNFDKSNLYFKTKITLTNNGSTAVSNLEYMRSFDPDQERDLPSGSYTTDNYLATTGVDPDKWLIAAEGIRYGLLVGFGALKDAADSVEVSTEGFSLRDPDEILDSPEHPSEANPQRRDQAIAIAFRFDTLAPGESVEFEYVTLLDSSDLDDALDSLASPPTAEDDDISLTEDDGNTDITGVVGSAGSGLLGNDFDNDGDTNLTIVAINDTTSKGILTFDSGAGTVSYDPNGEFEYLAVGESTTQTFEYTVMDSEGLTDTGLVTITINGVNDAPVITSLTSSAEDVANKSSDGFVAIEGTFEDVDLTDVHSATIDWGDGSAIESLNVNNNNDFFDGNHTYATGGIFTITVTLDDGNGGVATSTASAFVSGTGIIGDTLFIIGSPFNDFVEVNKQGTTHIQVNSSINNQWKQETFALADFAQFEIHVCEGDDTVFINQSLAVPATVYGAGGNDTVRTGSVDDYVDLGEGNNKIWSNSGNDTIITGSGNDEVWSGNGNDNVNAGDGNNKVWAGNDDDDVTTGDGCDEIFAGSGNDVADAGEGNNKVWGSDGDDILTTGSGDDEAFGGHGNDTINLGDGRNKAFGLTGFDTITGGSGDDEIHGGDDNDIIVAGDGTNRLFGNNGRDIIIAGSGMDFAMGGNGHDAISLGAGNDEVHAGPGKDVIVGGDGSERLFGGGGADLMIANIAANEDSVNELQNALNDWINGDLADALVHLRLLSEDNDDDRLWGGGDVDQLEGTLGDLLNQ